MRLLPPLTAAVLLLSSCIAVPTPEQQLADLRARTGFEAAADIPADEGMWLRKTHKGYPVLFRPQMGNVWGRYAARLAMGEIGRELGRVGQFLTGSYRSGVGGVAGSPLDRALSSVIGQPLTFYFVLKHGKPNAPRLDVVSDFSTVKPFDPEPIQGKIGFNAGSLYSSDSAFAQSILGDSALVEQLSNLRSQYIRVDEQAVTFIFAGSERDWSAEITERGGYPEYINDIVDILAKIADRIPSR
jgi:hypothetical protein